MSRDRVCSTRGLGALGLVASLVLAVSCSGSDGGSQVAGTARSVAVVSDSEITPEIVELMAAEPDIEVVYRHNAPGATIAELDEMLDEALATEPDALVYTAGANDLLASGIEKMLESLRVRLDDAGEAACVVYAVPAVDVSRMEAPDAEATRTILNGFSTVLDDWGVIQVPYLAIADEMAADGGNFFAGGELGSFHPSEAAYPSIASALIEGLEHCP